MRCSVLANQDWEPVLLGEGYCRPYFDGINCFYIPEGERPALQPCFEAPVNVLDKPYDREMVHARLQDRQREAARLTADRDALQSTVQIVRRRWCI